MMERRWLSSLLFGIFAVACLGILILPACSAPVGSCTASSECKDAGKNWCSGGQCKEGCETNEDCKKVGKATCTKNKCQGCSDDSACSGKKKCIGGACREGCAEDKDCESLGKNSAGEAAICQADNCILPCASSGDCQKGQYCKSRTCIKGTAPPSKKADELEACGDLGDECKTAEDCSKGDCYKGICLVKCNDGLTCKTWAGGSSKFCYRSCKRGCGKKICVKAEDFADGSDVCMNPVKKQGGAFSYSEGTFCDTKNGLQAIQPARGDSGFGNGRCWVICDLEKPSCEKGRNCVPLPGVTAGGGKPAGGCLKPCKATSDCEGIDGLVCKDNEAQIKDCKSDGDCGGLKCVSDKCKADSYCLTR